MTSPSNETNAEAVFDCSAMDPAHVSPTYLRARIREYLYSSASYSGRDQNRLPMYDPAEG